LTFFLSIRYVTCFPNSGLSNGSKIITLESLEKKRHAYDARSEGGSAKPAKKSGAFSCSGLFHNSVLEYHITDFSTELVTNMKTPSLNFQFETDNFKEFCHFFLPFFVYRPTFRPSVIFQKTVPHCHFASSLNDNLAREARKLKSKIEFED